MASPATLVVLVVCFLSVVIDALRLFVADDACSLSLSDSLSRLCVCVFFRRSVVT